MTQVICCVVWCSSRQWDSEGSFFIGKNHLESSVRCHVGEGLSLERACSELVMAQSQHYACGFAVCQAGPVLVNPSTSLFCRGESEASSPLSGTRLRLPSENLQASPTQQALRSFSRTES